MASAVSMAEALDASVVIIWNRNATLNAGFNCLFKYGDRFIVKEYNTWYRLLFYNGDKTYIRVLQKIIKL